MIYRHFSPVPKVFWSLETGMPFSRCSMCACDLMEEGVNYLVEKAYQKKEALFEYAMCYECYLGVQESLSEQSKKLIANYFEEHVDFDSRMPRMLEKNGKRTRSWLAHCMVKGTPRWKCEEHQIYGWFVDKDIVFNGMPYMLSGAVIDDLLKLLSPETTGALDDLSDKLFGIDLPQSVLLV